MRFSTPLLGIAIGSFALGCGGSDASERSTTAGSRDEITIAFGARPTTLDPHIADDGAERAINDNVYETLMARTPDGELTPGLADDEPERLDDTTWRFTLRDGVSFHDGTAFDSRAVVASVERMIEIGESGEQHSFFSTLSGAKAIDKLTVDVITTGPDPLLPARMYWLKIIPAGAADRPDFAEQPIGTGPYRLRSFDQEIASLEANEEYWGGRPPIGIVNIAFVGDASTRIAGVLSGRFDVVTNVPPEEARRVPQHATVAGLEHPLIILDVDDGITADVRVRRALNHAVDKQAIASGTFGGMAAVDPGQPLDETYFGFDPALEAYPYDPERARSLIEEAGVAGESIQLIGVADRWLKDRETVEAVAGYWQDAGLEVSVEILEFGTWLETWSDRTARPDAIFLNSSNELLDADRTLSVLYHPDGIGSSNTDPELGDLIDDARTEVDVDRRTELYSQALRLARDDAYFVFLVRVEDSYGLSERMSWTPRTDAKLLAAEMSLTT